MADEEELPPPPAAAPPSVSADTLIEAIRTAPLVKIVELLPGADANASAAGGETPLVTASTSGRTEVIVHLLKAGASVDAPTSSGMRALAAAASGGHLACVEKLLKAGASVDATCGRERSTALILAARNGHRACCEKLMDAGGDPALADAYGETAQAAAHRFEKEARQYSSTFKEWSDIVSERAATIEAEPPVPPPLFPLNPLEDLTRWYRSSDPTKMLWRPGAWVHMKRPAAGPTMVQQRPRAFEATGFGVQPRVVEPEESVFPAERYGMQDTLGSIQGDSPDALTLKARIARERSTKNPQMFNDDVPLSNQSMRATILDAKTRFGNISRQEAKLSTAFTESEVPLRIGDAPTYSSGLQRATMGVPTAAATLYPMLAPPPASSLSGMLLAPRPPPPAEEGE
jgi:hypothetical protein